MCILRGFLSCCPGEVIAAPRISYILQHLEVLLSH